MDDDSWGIFGGDDGVASSDGVAWLGTIDTGSQLDEDAVNATVLNNPIQPTSGSLMYYGGSYRKLLDDLTASNVRVANRAGALLNLAAGVPSVRSTSTLDAGTLGNAARTGLQVRLVCEVSGSKTEQYLNLNGTTPSSDVSGGAQIVDLGKAWRWEASLNGSPTDFWGDVGCYIGTQLCAVLRGKLNPRRGITGKANRMCSAEVQLALASAKNTSISGTDRLVAPSGIGSFDPAVYFGGNSEWVGTDQSLSAPGGPYVQNDFLAIIVQFEAVAGILSPLGAFQCDPQIICNA